MLRIRHPLAVLAATAAAGAALAAPAAAAPVQRIFAYTGAVQTWQVPPGVTEATFTLVGQSGASGAGPVPALGGQGAELRATLPVIPGQVYEVWVGGSGAAETSGFSAGGAGGANLIAGATGGDGGDATDVRLGQNGGLNARVLVAAGGGGGGGAGNVGGGGVGGAAGANGIAGQPGGATTGGGGGFASGIFGAPGTGALGFSGEPGQPGVQGLGGDGGTQTTGVGGNGGGGGGGVTGGGGGGAGGSASALTEGAGGGGGAGGQSYAINTAHNVSTELAATRGNGVAVVSYEPLSTPEVRTQPSLSGVAEVGRQLTCELGTWSGSPTLAVAWLRNGTPIANATTAQYTLQTADGGQQVACQVTATNAVGSTVARTPAIGVPVLAGPANTAPPAVTGTAAIGSRVTCNPGTWGGSPAFAYTWLRNGRPIANQTQSTYTLARADAGMTVQCAVRATADGLSTTAQSVAVGGPARLVILNQTALVSRAGSVTVVLGCFGSTDCRVARVTATSGQVIARSGRRVVRAGATSRVVLTLGRRGLSKLRRAGSSIPVRFVSLPEGGYGGNVRMTWVALRGTS